MRLYPAAKPGVGSGFRPADLLRREIRILLEIPHSVLVLAVVVVALVLIAVLELAVAAVPMLILIMMVPAHERRDLAELAAATDSSRRLRLWPALNTAVTARRTRRQR